MSSPAARWLVTTLDSTKQRLSGIELISAGGTAIGLMVSSGGDDFVLGLASNTTVFSGGQEIISAGGTTIRATLSGIAEAGLEAAEVISAGGSAVGLMVGSGGADFVYGMASNTTVFGGGNEVVNSGGSAIGVTVSSGSLSSIR